MADLERNKAGGGAPTNVEQVGYPVRPYTQLLHDQSSYAHPHMRPTYGNPHYMPAERLATGYPRSSSTPHLADHYLHSASSVPHRNSLATSHPVQHHSQPPNTSISTHTPTGNYQPHPPPTSQPSIQPHPPPYHQSHHSYANPLSMPGYQATAAPLQPAHALPPPPVYQSTQQSRKGMMFNEYSGTLNLF
ncbi:hypothetical protein K493DRAFT_315398 [Basidiobolus meristosporus CBS 931.73]|uniref:Uncharacterized protein n=1 Tax=Basidiobolus meristosporus CBS 931.73 TaxID=1314790 RepID=A0A1Y1Y9C2_9FUNG|nr:hypothetical protein K493DRAFT_315398 [Basidiobolus meristosporus CBS 931.73]|eukprot:ORX94609.1 hypothetical protein K493DRAFT_315398 [Basidiobolus meristosporus CBS 931.73]